MILKIKLNVRIECERNNKYETKKGKLIKNEMKWENVEKKVFPFYSFYPRVDNWCVAQW